MNPIENCWSLLKRRVPPIFSRIKIAQSKTDVKVNDFAVLKLAIAEAWHSDEMKQMALNCIESMPREFLT